jgi:hypothetical protein
MLDDARAQEHEIVVAGVLLEMPHALRESRARIPGHERPHQAGHGGERDREEQRQAEPASHRAG